MIYSYFREKFLRGLLLKETADFSCNGKMHGLLQYNLSPSHFPPLPLFQCVCGKVYKQCPHLFAQLYKYTVAAVLRLLRSLIIIIYSTQTACMKIGNTVRSTTKKPTFLPCSCIIFIVYTFVNNVLCKHTFSEVNFI